MNTRTAAFESLFQIIKNEKDYNTVLDRYSSSIKHFTELTKLVSGVLKNLLLLDFIIEKVTNKKIKSLSINTLNILRLALFELIIMKNPDYAVLNSYVDLAKSKDSKAKSYINWSLREYVRVKNKINLSKFSLEKKISVAYSIPVWLINNWLKYYGKKKTYKLCSYFNRQLKLVLRTNLIKISNKELEALFTKNDIKYTQTPINDCFVVEHSGNIREIPGYHQGYWAVQGLSSSLVAHVIDPKDNEEILDVCAAPGGKTTHIASLSNNNAFITALEISPQRADRIIENCKRLGVINVSTIISDATTAVFNSQFDKILIDAPCSNTGVLNKRPDARLKRKEKDVKALSELQYKIIQNISKYLKINGELVYSTCSLEKEENQGVIEKFLKENSNFKLVNIDIDNLKFKKTDKYLSIVPFLHDTEGFFIAKMVRYE